MAERGVKINFLGDAKGLSRAAKDAISSLDDTESAGARVARAIEEMGAKLEAEIRDAASATDVLRQALGGEVVAAIESSGRSVDGLVEDLHRAGLTYDDIRADADQLATAIGGAEAAAAALRSEFDNSAVAAENLDSHMGTLNTATGETHTKLGDVRGEADQTRNVLANMVGNSAQDLGALGGVAGTAGMAIGQLAEYAADGSISMKGLATFAGPMAGVALAVGGISWAMDKVHSSSQKAKEEAEGMLKVQQALRDGKYDEAASTLADSYKGTALELQKLGIGTDAFIRQITGQGDIVGDLEGRYADLSAQIDAATLGQDALAHDGVDPATEALRVQRDQLGQLITNVKSATGAFAEQGRQLTTSEQLTNAMSASLKGVTADAMEASGGFATVDRSAQDYADEVARAEQATRAMDDAYRALTGSLDVKDKWDDTAAAIWNYHSSLTHSDQETRDYIRSLGEMVMALDNVPDETKAKLIAQLEEGDITTVESYLQTWAKGVDVPVRFKGQGDVGFEKMAKGGRLNAGQPYIVGDNPDGTLNATSELFVPDTAGTLLSAADTRNALGAGTMVDGYGGAQVVNIWQVNVPETANPAETGRVIRQYLDEYERIT